MTNLQKKQKALENLKKIQSNLCEYIDELAIELKPMVKSKVINPSKFDVFDVIDMCYYFEHNTEVFGSYKKELILDLFNSGTFTNQFATDLTRSFQLQLYKNQ